MAQRISVQASAEGVEAQHLMADPPKLGVIDKIAANALFHPNATAVATDDAEITYADLMAAVDELATEMAAAGVGPEVTVGICVPRSPELVVGVLATLRAGGAFLPVDPGWPQERIRGVLDDARAPVVVAPAERVASLTAPHRQVIVARKADNRRLVAGMSPPIARRRTSPT
jgi:non-ribosomal peptide synthetase component F